MQLSVDKYKGSLSSDYGTERGLNAKSVSEYTEEEQMRMAIEESLKPQWRTNLWGSGDSGDVSEGDSSAFGFAEDDSEKGEDNSKCEGDKSNISTVVPPKPANGTQRKDVSEQKREGDVSCESKGVKRKAEDRGVAGQYQFKIRGLDGKCVNASFWSGDSVQDIREYVDANIKPSTPYRVFLSYPKRLLDNDAKLSDLHVPTRAVLVLESLE